MEINLFEKIYGKPLTIRDLINGFYENTQTGSVVAFGGKLDIRPPYQREFVYGPEKQKAVIQSILDKHPINVMYWAKNDDGNFELIDGQQRILSICKFADGQFGVPYRIGSYDREAVTFSGLNEMQEGFLDYPLLVFVCEGKNDEKMAWFKKINTAGLELTNQEMLNAIYNGTWVNDAKKYFSRDKGAYIDQGASSNGRGYGDYIDVSTGEKSEKKDSVIRQALLEKVIKWKMDSEQYNNGIEDYMDEHRNDATADELKEYFKAVMEWTKKAFPTYHPEMKKVEWGILYNIYKENNINKVGKMAERLYDSKDDISNIGGIYEAVLSNDFKHINARKFDEKDKKWAYNNQDGYCPLCHNHFEYNEMQGDHIKPWSKGGKTDRDNLQMLCSECNIKKSNYDSKYTPFDGQIYKDFSLDKWNAANPAATPKAIDINDSNVIEIED